MTGRSLNLTSASEVEAQAVRWLWPGYVPRGKITVLAGAPGLGKSLLTLLLVARVARAADVLIASAEDDPADTIKPRLVAAGADCHRVHLLDVREWHPNGYVVPGIVQLPGDAHAIHVAVKETGAQLVVVDPVAAFLDGDHNAYIEQDVRAAMAPLKLMAEETGAAVVVVMHLNKADGSDALRRIGNSGAFTALARSVLLFGPDPEDEEGDRGSSRILTVAKGNLRGPGRGSLALRIVTRPVAVVGGEIEAAALEIVGDSNVSAEDLLGTGEERRAKGDAMRWLRDLLADGPVAATEVQARAKEEGLAHRTLKRAKYAAGVTSAKDGTGGWVWCLPVPLGPVGPVGPLPANTGNLGWPPSTESGPLGGKGAKGAKEANTLPRAPAREEPTLLEAHGDLDGVVEAVLKAFPGAVEITGEEAA